MARELKDGPVNHRVGLLTTGSERCDSSSAGSPALKPPSKYWLTRHPWSDAPSWPRRETRACAVHSVERGRFGVAFGLFVGGGWLDDVDEVLQLGRDLTDCPGWRNETKLVADLRNPAAYEPARFEVGAWAGLRRVGLTPAHEVAENRADPRADFVVSDGGRCFAIELKNLADPQRERNVGRLGSLLASFGPTLLAADIGRIDLNPCEELEDLFDMPVEQFALALDRLWPRVIDVLKPGLAIGRYDIEGVGSLVVRPRDPTWTENIAGHIGADVEDSSSLEGAARRVLRRVASARTQLAATNADLRAVVVWGGLDHMPCHVIGVEIRRQIAAGWVVHAADYIGLLNCHFRGPRPGWTTEGVLFAVREGLPPPDSMKWPTGLVAWSLLHAT